MSRVTLTRSVDFKFVIEDETDFKIGEAASGSVYQDLAAVTEANDFYEPISKQPSKSSDKND